MIKVFDKRCKNCLYSDARIVSPEEAAKITDECIEQGTHFICHVATMNNGEDVMCRGYHDSHGDSSAKLRLARRLNAVRYIPQPDTDAQLVSYADQVGEKPKRKGAKKKGEGR